MPSPDPFELWQMSEVEFNTWRQTHDLPLLLHFFQSALPHFREWQKSFGITDEWFVKCSRQSDLLTERHWKYLVTASHLDDGRATYVSSKAPYEILAYHDLQWHGVPRPIIHSSQAFLPYFHWLRSCRGIYFFPIIGDRNNAVTSDLRYMLKKAPHRVGSRAYLFKSHPVLKLGGTRVHVDRFDGRNLDFVDLDGLTVFGDGATHETVVSYSSCENIQFLDCNKAFLHFKNCDVEHLRFEKCKLQDIHFYRCNVYGASFSASRLYRVSFVKSHPAGLRLSNCELIEFDFSKPPKRISKSAVADVYRRLRRAYQEDGKRHEAAESYYRERFNEMLSRMWPVFPTGSRFPRRFNTPLFLTYQYWKVGAYSSKQVVRFAFGNLVANVITLVYPKYLIRFLNNKIKAVSAFLEWLIWGFGERPSFLIWWAPVIIFGFAAYYYLFAPQLIENWRTSLFYSVYSFAGMNYGDASAYLALRGPTALEAVLGVFFLGLLIAGFANKSRY